MSGLCQVFILCQVYVRFMSGLCQVYVRFMSGFYTMSGLMYDVVYGNVM